MTIIYKKKEQFFDLYHNDCLSQLRLLASNSVDAVVSDPPAGISFCNAKWDHDKGGRDQWVTWMTRVMKEVYRVVKPGGHILIWSIPKTMHWTGWAIESAGFESKGQIYHINGCLDTDTEIVTSTGVKPYHRLEIGEPVLVYNLDSKGYSYQPILEIMEYDYEDTAYRLIGDFGEQVVTRRHRVIVEQDGRETFNFAETLQSEACIPILEDLPKLREVLRGYESFGDKKTKMLQQNLWLDDSQDGSCRCFGEETGGSKRGFLQLLCVWKRDLEAYVRSTNVYKYYKTNLQSKMQRYSAGGGLGTTWAQRECSEDSRGFSFFQRENFWGEKSSLERRDYENNSEGKLQKLFNKVCSVPSRVYNYVSERWLCYGTPSYSFASNSEITFKNGSGTSYKSQSRGQSCIKSNVVQNEYGSQEVRGWSGHKTSVVRVVPFKYTGKVWCVRVATGAFVASRKGVTFPTGNSSFPKNMDISRAIDKQFGLEREVTGVKPGHEEFAHRTTTGHLDGDGGANAFDRPWMHDPEKQKAFHLQTAPASPQAKKWEGWGTQIKTSAEPWWLAQKPISEPTIAKNVMKWGVGGINIDKSRVPLASVGEDKRLGGNGTWNTEGMGKNTYEGGYAGIEVASNQLGRFPSNVILTHTEECAEYEDGSCNCHPDCPVNQFPDSLGQRGDLLNHYKPRESPNGIFGAMSAATNHPKREETSVSAARFFYTAKASGKDRDAYVPEGMYTLKQGVPNDIILRIKELLQMV